MAENRGVHPDRIVIPRIEPAPAPRSRWSAQSDAAEESEATINELRRQLAEAGVEIENLRERASYFESMLDMHLEKTAKTTSIPTDDGSGERELQTRKLNATYKDTTTSCQGCAGPPAMGNGKYNRL